MLILTRRVGEAVKIGDEVTVTILGVKGSQVRIGIDAPKTVSVHREEIFDRIKGEKARFNRRHVLRRRIGFRPPPDDRQTPPPATPGGPGWLYPSPPGQYHPRPVRDAGELAEWSKAHPC